MKRKLMLMVCVAALAACQKSELQGPINTQGRSDIHFTATVESPTTKTALDGTNVIWSNNDQIAIFEGVSAANKYQVAEGGSTNASLNFVSAHGTTSTDLSPATNVAIYPYLDGIECENVAGEDGKYTIKNYTLPAAQNYVEGNIPLGANLMAAVTASATDGQLSFKNVGGAIKFSLKGEIKVKSIEVKGNNGEKLAGKAAIKVAKDANPVITFDTDNSVEIVSLNCGDGVQLSADQPTVFYLTLPPTTFTAGFTLTVKDDQGKIYQKAKTTEAVITRSQVLSMPTLEMSAFNEATRVTTTEELKSALAAGSGFILLASGEYSLGGATVAADVTIEGEDKSLSVIKMENSIYPAGKSVTFKNLTYTVPTGLHYAESTFGFIHRATQVNFNNCAINGGLRVNSDYVNIDRCTFTVNTSSGFDGYALFYYGGTEVNVSHSTFNTAGKGIVLYKEGVHEYKLNVNSCTFTSSATTSKAAIQMHTECGISGEVRIKNSGATGL